MQDYVDLLMTESKSVSLRPHLGRLPAGGIVELLFLEILYPCVRQKV
jgi:hypothetical protein